MSKDPAILFYTADFLTGTMLFTDEQVGKYIRLLCLQHQKGHLTENDMLIICKSYDNDIFSKFEKTPDGKYHNLRMHKEILKRSAYSDSRRKNRMSKSYVEHMEDEDININRDVVKDLDKRGTGGEKGAPVYIDGDLPQLPIQVLEHYQVLADLWRASGVVVETGPAQTAYTMYVRGAVDWTDCEKAGRNYLERCTQEKTQSKYIKRLENFLKSWRDWVSPPAPRLTPDQPAADIVCRKCGVTKIKAAGGMCRACIRQMEDDAAAEKAAYSGTTDSPGAKKFMEEVKKLTEAKRVTGISGGSGKYPCTVCGKEHNDTPGALCRPCSASALKTERTV